MMNVTVFNEDGRNSKFQVATDVIRIGEFGKLDRVKK